MRTAIASSLRRDLNANPWSAMMVGVLACVLAVFTLATSADANPPSAPIRVTAGFGDGGAANIPTYDFVFAVQTCDDSGPLSLRNAISTANAGGHIGAVIYFPEQCDVILVSPLPAITANNVFVAGNGSTLRGHGLVVKGAQNVLIQDLRIKHAAFDGIGIRGPARNVHVQHVTITGATDGSIDITDGPQDVTVMYSILTSPVNTPKRASTNMMISDNTCGAETKRVTLLYNLFANSRARNPIVQRDNCGNIATDTTAEVLGNVVANWTKLSAGLTGGQGIVVMDGAKANIVSNYLTNPDATAANQTNGVFVCHPDATTGCTGLDATGEA
jgi:hypothetical protein